MSACWTEVLPNSCCEEHKHSPTGSAQGSVQPSGQSLAGSIRRWLEKKIKSKFCGTFKASSGLCLFSSQWVSELQSSSSSTCYLKRSLPDTSPALWESLVIARSRALYYSYWSNLMYVFCFLEYIKFYKKYTIFIHIFKIFYSSVVVCSLGER